MASSLSDSNFLFCSYSLYIYLIASSISDSNFLFCSYSLYIYLYASSLSNFNYVTYYYSILIYFSSSIRFWSSSLSFTSIAIFPFSSSSFILLIISSSFLLNSSSQYCMISFSLFSYKLFYSSYFLSEFNNSSLRLWLSLNSSLLSLQKQGSVYKVNSKSFSKLPLYYAISYSSASGLH